MSFDTGFKKKKKSHKLDFLSSKHFKLLLHASLLFYFFSQEREKKLDEGVRYSKTIKQTDRF